MDFNVPLANAALVAGGEGEGHPRRVPCPDSQNQWGNPRALAMLTACTSAWSHPAAQHHPLPLGSATPRFGPHTSPGSHAGVRQSSSGAKSERERN